MRKPKHEKAPTKPAAKSRAFASADTALRINAAEFIAWQEGLGLSNAAAARLLYVSANTLAAYRAEGAGADIARQCRAIRLGIRPDDSWQFIERAAKMLETLRQIIPAE